MESTASSSLREFILTYADPRRPRGRSDRTGVAARSAARARPFGDRLRARRSSSYDLSLANRRAKRKTTSCSTPPKRSRQHGIGLKAATITPEAKGRRRLAQPHSSRTRSTRSVIVRTGRRLPRVRPVAGIHAPISVVRMAVGDAYGAKEWREGEGVDEVALPHRNDLARRLPRRRRVRVRPCQEKAARSSSAARSIR